MGNLRSELRFRAGPALGFFAGEIGLLGLGVAVNPWIMCLAPPLLLGTGLLVADPGVSLLLVSLTGVIKGLIVEQFLSTRLDLTVVLMAVLALGLLVRLLSTGLSIPKELHLPVGFFAAFVLTVLLGGLHTPATQEGATKIARFAFIAFPMFLAPILIVRTAQDSSRYLRIFRILALAVGFAVVGVLIYLVVTGGLLKYAVRVTIPGANPIGVARYVALGCALAAAGLMAGRRDTRWLQGGLAIVLFLGVVVTGSRGALAGLGMGVVTYALFFEPKYRRAFLAYSLLTVLLLVVLLTVLPENLTYRYLQTRAGDLVLTQTGVQRYSTVSSRLDFWALAFSTSIGSLKNFLIGIGTGGFGSLFIWKEFRWHPHNLFFEVLVENGIVGLTLLLGFLFSTLALVWRHRIGGHLPRHVGLWVMPSLVMFFQAMVSGDINDNRILWLLLGFTLISVARADKIITGSEGAAG